MLGLRGLIASCLLASALASPHLISAEIAGPRIERTRGLKGAGIQRDSRDSPLFSREPGAPMVRRDGLVARTDSKTFSFEQTLEDQVIFNRYSTLATQRAWCLSFRYAENTDNGP